MRTDSESAFVFSCGKSCLVIQLQNWGIWFDFLLDGKGVFTNWHGDKCSSTLCFSTRSRLLGNTFWIPMEKCRCSCKLKSYKSLPGFFTQFRVFDAVGVYCTRYVKSLNLVIMLGFFTTTAMQRLFTIQNMIPGTAKVISFFINTLKPNLPEVLLDYFVNWIFDGLFTQFW